jgi:hypothetical protein
MTSRRDALLLGGKLGLLLAARLAAEARLCRTIRHRFAQDIPTGRSLF